MPRYMVSWKANSSVWPTDPKEKLAVLEGAFGGGDQLLETGAAAEISWLTPEEGYVILEADSKASALGMVQGFFPYYSQDVREAVSWEDAKKAMLDSARQAAAR
jgi:hypothetical protein